MPGGDNAKKFRRYARQELDIYRIDLLRIGGCFAEAVQSHSDNWFALAREFVDRRSSATDLIKNSVATGIQCLQVQKDLAEGISRVIHKRRGPRPPKPVLVGGVIVFSLDQYTQTTDPFPIGVPIASGGAGVSVTAGSTIRPENICLSDASDGQTMEVALVQLGVEGARVFPTEGDYTATLVWAGGSQPIKAVVKFI